MSVWGVGLPSTNPNSLKLVSALKANLIHMSCCSFNRLQKQVVKTFIQVGGGGQAQVLGKHSWAASAAVHFPNASKLMFTTLPLQHEPYRRLWQRFSRLEKWLELAVRPNSEECPEDKGWGAPGLEVAICSNCATKIQVTKSLKAISWRSVVEEWQDK